MKVYYSHPMKFYGTKIEKEDIAIIEKNFPHAEVITPPSYEMSEKKEIEGMTFCHRLIDECEIVVFCKLFDVVTSGVGDEVNYALAKRKRVYEIKDKTLVPHSKPLKYISRAQTRRIYRMIDQDDKWKSKIR